MHVSPLYSPFVGGSEIHIRALSEGLAARGHRVTVVTTSGRDPYSWAHADELPRAEVVNGVRVVRVEPDGGRLGRAFERWQLLRGSTRTSLAAFGEDGLAMLNRKPSMAQLLPLLARVAVDVVTTINWAYPPAYYAHLAHRFRRFIFVGIPLFHTEAKWVQRPIYNRMLARCDAILANTSYEAEYVRSRGATRAEIGGAGVYPGAFSVRDGAAVRARYGLGSSLLVGFVGQQTRSKGVVALIRAMRTVWAWDSEVRLLLAGVPPPPGWNDRDDALEALSDWERKRIVRIDGFEEADKASIYDALDMLVLPSTDESFGIAYLEAWMCRKPVIGARVGSTQCVIGDGVDGLLVDPMEPDDIARSIIRLASDPGRRETMGRNGYAKTLEKHTWEKVTDRVERLYLELATSRASDGFSRGGCGQPAGRDVVDEGDWRIQFVTNRNMSGAT